ncbi:MAG: TIGR00730 family Rossman fold protein [Pseudomonadota bacterium]
MTELRSLCVYCGSRHGNEPRFIAAAEELGQLTAAAGVRLVYGGGDRGLMGTTASAARDAGGDVLGIIPTFITKTEGLLPGIPIIEVETMHERKIRMFDEADALCALPGGIGTLEEAIEILSWASLKLHKKPIVVCNIEGYWSPLVELIDHINDFGFGYPGLREAITVVDSASEVVSAAKEALKA